MVEQDNFKLWILTNVAGFFGIRQCGTISAEPFTSDSLRPMKKYMCLICGWIYDEELGWPDDGIAPGTRWDDVPLTWTCPECSAVKDDFEMVEI